jgi:hypothetical protein
MKWGIKVGVEWRQSKAGRPKIGVWPTMFPSFLPFPSTIYHFSSITTPLGQSRGAMDILASPPTTILDRPVTSWLPYKRVAKERLLLHPTSSQATSNSLNPSPSS